MLFKNSSYTKELFYFVLQSKVNWVYDVRRGCISMCTKDQFL